MRALAPLVSLLPFAAQADAPFFSYDGHTAPIMEITPDGGLAESYVTLGGADREIVTLFSGTDAIHTRHYTVDGAPVAMTSTGGCVSFY